MMAFCRWIMGNETTIVSLSIDIGPVTGNVGLAMDLAKKDDIVKCVEKIVLLSILQKSHAKCSYFSY